MNDPWPQGAELGPAGLVVRGRRATDLAEEHGTPLIVVDERHFRERCRSFVAGFDRALWAVKAFPAHALIRLAHDEGMGLLAATGGELDACLRAGVPAGDVVLHGNNKLDEEIDTAIAEGVGHLILDSDEDVGRIAAAARRADRVQPVLLRLAPAVEVAAHAYVTTGAPDTKFGAPVAEGMAMSALKNAISRAGLSVRGVHVHVGSQLLDPSAYLGALEVALDFLAEARDSLGFRAEVLDIGGGLGSRYRDERPPTPEAIAAVVRERLVAGCESRGLAVPTLWGEPGRAVSGGSALTLYRVGAVKEVPGIRRYVAVDGGMSDNIRPALYGARYTFALASRASSAPEAEVAVVGRHCESGDILDGAVPLPEDVRRGDLLAVAATGAYEYAMAGNYNKVGRPAVVLVEDEGARLIARREQLEDLARLDALEPGVSETEPPPGVEVRPARARDARGVRDLIESVAREGRFIRTERVTSSPRQFRRRFQRSWTPDAAEIVAIAEGRVVGHLGVARERGAAVRHVAGLGMGVEKGWRGRGVGAALMTAVVRWARWAGVEKLTLTVFPHNRPARALYRRFGFREEGVLRGHTKKSYGYEDEIVMSRWVSERADA